MKSRTNAAFRKLLAALPRNVREQAVAAYLLFAGSRTVNKDTDRMQRGGV